MTKYNDVMIDIETFGTNNNALVVQVALAYFDRNTGQVGDSTIINIDVEDSLKYGFKMDEETLDWWSEQPKEIFESLQVNPFSCVEAAENIYKFLSYDALIWCHATFDAPLLANFYKTVKDDKMPYKYRNVRDIRTVVDLAGLDLDKYDWDKEKTHNALSDVLFQIKYVTDACNMLKFRCTQEEAILVRETIAKKLAEQGS